MAAFLSTFELKLIFLGVITFSVITGYFVWQTHERNIGYAHAVADVRAANLKEEGMATKGQLKVESCFSAGGTWDRDSGTCLQ